MEASSAFAARLREVRAEAKMTQHELAERSGVHRQTIAQLETGVRRPAWDTVRLLARALGVSCSAFESDEGAAAGEARPRGRLRQGDAETAAAKRTRKRKRNER